MTDKTDQELLAFMQLSRQEKLSYMISGTNAERRAHPEKYAYQKLGLYIAACVGKKVMK